MDYLNYTAIAVQVKTWRSPKPTRSAFETYENLMEEVAEQLADIFSVFSNAKRVLIFWTLDGVEKPVNEIARSIDASMQNTSQHLRLMKGKGILASRRNGQTIYYRIADSEVAGYCRLLHEEMFKSFFEQPTGREAHQMYPLAEERDLPAH